MAKWLAQSDGMVGEYSHKINVQEVPHELFPALELRGLLISGTMLTFDSIPNPHVQT
jgi:hypothetical protein